MFLFVLGLPVLAAAQTPGALVPTPAPPTPTPTVDLKKAPKITCAKPNYDFGEVLEGPDINHNFHFINKGKSNLKVTNVGTSCGCTAAVVASKHPLSAEDQAAGLKAVIPPGGSGTIKATYHTQGRPGHATKIITVSTNDPTNPGYQMKLDMTVVREIDLQPDRLYLYGTKFKEEKKSSIKVLGRAGVKMHVLSVESSSKVVTVTGVAPVTEIVPASTPTPGQPAPKEQKRYGANIDVLLPATQPIGSFTDELTIKTDNPKKPEVKVSIMGEVVGRVQYNPKNISFSPHQDTPVTIQLTADPAKGFEIRGVKSNKHLARPSIRTTTSPDGNKQYSLVVSVVKEVPKDSDGKDQVIVSTNDKDQPEISIDVQANK